MKLLLILLVLLVAPHASLGQQDELDDWGDDEWADDESGGLQWSGFVEGAGGTRWDKDPQVGRSQTLGEVRLRAETSWDGERFTIDFKGDAWYDNVIDEFDADLRDLSLSFSPSDTLDLKLGRQVLTWGTGDLLFLNDLFPKGWVSFFAGRDDEYLKAPSNTVRATWYTSLFNIDLAWTPVFEPDEFLTGERFSFYSPLAGQRVAPQPPLNPVKPARTLDNGELAIRLFKTINGTEYAAYGYGGFFKQPTALTDSFEPTFSRLTALGVSVRKTLGPGLMNAETSYYASRDDRDGTNPNVPNDQLRLLLGYELEAMTSLTIAFQYYLEWTQDHDELIANSPTPAVEPDEYRHVLTNRLTYRIRQDKLTLSLFTFYSPSDKDYYLRPVINYRYSDSWSYTFGGNIFGGDEPHTFFNQFADNGNVYARFRYNY
jgi:hypothetical protein